MRTKNTSRNRIFLNLSVITYPAITLLLLFSFFILNSLAETTYTEVGGPIISDTTWKLANSPYVVTSNVQVLGGITLTIEPGVVVKFDADKLLQVDGTMVARGNSSSRITFTSSQINPQPGDWDKIFFSDNSVDAVFDGNGNYQTGSIMQFCIVGYGGDNNTGAIETESASPYIDYCVVHRNGGGNFYPASGSSGIYAVGTTSNPIILSNNIVSNNCCRYSGGGIVVINGIVTDNFVDNNVSTFYGGGILAQDSSISNNIITNNWTGTDGGGIHARDSLVIENIVRDNFANENGGGIYTDAFYKSITVSHNTLIGNSAGHDAWYGGGGGIYANGGNFVTLTVISNTISSNTADYGGGINAFSGEVIIKGNIVTDNAAGSGGGISGNGTIDSNIIVGNQVPSTGQGSGMSVSGEITNNTVVGNSTTTPTTQPVGGIAISEGQLHNNNIYDNSPYDAVVVASEDISGTLNYWGTNNNVNILAQVFDWYDDVGRGRLLYVPFLQDPDPNAPVPPPLNFQANFIASSAILSWDPIPSTTTGYGYKVYYDTDSPEPPYVGTGLPQGNSPIDVGNATNHTLTGLNNGTYYVTITTYDTLGRESWYANVAEKLYKVYLPITLKSY